MRISRNYKVEDWKQLSFKGQADWDKAVAIFEDRLETRYLEHIRAVLDRKTSGFVVLALDSALIETLEQFWRGTRSTPYRQGKSYFISFFGRTSFSNHFDDKLGGLFYETIRCGLLHQSEAKSNSRIKRGTDGPLVAYTMDHTGVVVNTNKFHALLERVVQEYATDLRDPNSEKPREAFRRKMNYICRIEEKEIELDEVSSSEQ
jgi:hypothetical protein